MTVPSTAPSLDLSSLLASQLNAYLTYDQHFTIEKCKKINFVLASNGVFRVEKTPAALYKTKISETATPIPGLMPMEEGPELLIPKIPFRLLQMALTFYRDVYDQDKTEASLLFFYNHQDVRLPTLYSDDTEIKGLLAEGRFVIYVPRQVNSSGLSEFHMDPMVDWLRNKMVPICESHSHHTMNAFFSGTDDAHEKATQFYFVWGHIKHEQPAYAFRYVSGDAKEKICPSVLFEWPIIHTTITYGTSCNMEGFEPKTERETKDSLYLGPFPRADYPDEWMQQHKKKAVAKSIDPYRYPSKPSTYSMQEEMLLFEEDLYPDFYEKELEYQEKQLESYRKQRESRGMEEAEVLHYFDETDEIIHYDIKDNIRDIASEFSRLGLDTVIERTIEATKK